MRFSAFFCASSALVPLLGLLVVSPARAEDPLVMAVSMADAAPTLTGTVASPVPAASPAASPAAPAPPAPPAPPAEGAVTVGPYRCVYADPEVADVDAGDAQTTADLVCTELLQRRAPVGEYALSFGKLGKRLLLGVTAKGSGESRRLFIAGVDEVQLAVPRLVGALVAKKPLAETQNVDNVVSSDSHKPKSKSLSTSYYFGLVGMGGAGEVPPAVSAGADVAVWFRSSALSFGGRARVGGLGTSDAALGFASVDLGARYHLNDRDVAPFLGAGTGFGYYEAHRTDAPSPHGEGFGAYLEGGVDLMRTSSAGASLSLRADVPFYALRAETSTYAYPSYASTTTSVQRYVVPISLNFGLAFR